MNSRALLAWLKPKAGRACWSRPSTTASRRVRYWLRNANGHERKGARTSGVASSSWPSMTEPLLTVTLPLDKYANWATQGGRLFAGGILCNIAAGESFQWRRGADGQLALPTIRWTAP